MNTRRVLTYLDNVNTAIARVIIQTDTRSRVRISRIFLITLPVGTVLIITFHQTTIRITAT